MQIRPNLDTALRALRLPNQARRLWVDALCIDQGNIDERSRQAQYMRLMYEHAARTFVRLGVQSPGIDDVFVSSRLSQISKTQMLKKRQSSGNLQQFISLSRI